MITIEKTILPLIILVTLTFSACSGDSSESKPKAGSEFTSSEADPMEDRGIGPVKELVFPAEIDMTMADEGKVIYKEMCTACHKADKKYIGPSPQGIFERRNPAWVMNMILNPEEMVEKNPIARKLLIAHNGSPMANQNLTEEQARAVVEYFRTLK